jgi:hypothetical protein
MPDLHAVEVVEGTENLVRTGFQLTGSDWGTLEDGVKPGSFAREAARRGTRGQSARR